MIFATVGTHEQPFDRLIRALDQLVERRVISEEVVIQSGYATYTPTHCHAEAMIPFDAVQAHMARARIVITHGGPASILQAMSHGKVPIVVPRQHRHGEHVDDHQVRFARRLTGRAFVIEDIATLESTIRDYDTLVRALPAASATSPAAAFASRLDALCGDLLAGHAKGRS